MCDERCNTENDVFVFSSYSLTVWYYKIICFIFGIPKVASKRLVKYEGKNRRSIQESLHQQCWGSRQKINTTLCFSEVSAATGAACQCFWGMTGEIKVQKLFVVTENIVSLGSLLDNSAFLLSFCFPQYTTF